MPTGVVRAAEAAGRPWPDPIEGPWKVRLVYARRGGRQECVGLTIQPWRDSGPLTQTELRKLSLRSLIALDHADQVQRARTALDRLHSPELEPHTDRRQLAALSRTVEASMPGRRGRRALYGDDHYRTVAAYYSDVSDAAAPNPTQLVAEAWCVSKSTAATWVREARRRGMLPPTTRGVARGAERGEDQ
jgi:hypothetical protein